MLNAIIRLLLLYGLVLVGVLVGMFAFLIPFHGYRRVARWWHRAVIVVVGVRCAVSGEVPAKGVLLVSNHISWLDICLLGAVCDAVFLSKREVRSWPLCGYMVARAGTLFIDRGKGAAAATGLISATLANRERVVIFPEGGTTDGLALRKFQPRLLQAAVNIGAPVQPVSLTYLGRSGRITTIPGYTGNRSFMASVWRVLRYRGLRAVVHIFPPLPEDMSRDALAKQAEKMITEHRKSLQSGVSPD